MFNNKNIYGSIIVILVVVVMVFILFISYNDAYLSLVEDAKQYNQELLRMLDS